MENLKTIREQYIWRIIGVLFGISVLIFFMAMAEFEFIFGLCFTGGLIALCVDFIIAYDFYEIANEKGYHDIKYFWYCFIIGAIGYIMVTALPNRTGATKTYDELPEL